jgi:uncharacterized phage-like protein YoqJ
MIKTKSACFSGHRASKLPYSENSIEYEKFEVLLKLEIIKLVRDGYVDFYAGGQNGIDLLCSMLVLNIKEELGATINLHVILPYKDIDKGLSQSEKGQFHFVKKEAYEVVCLNEKYTPKCYRQRNQYMVDKSDLLLAVFNGDKQSGTGMTINLAKRKGIDMSIFQLSLIVE